MRSMFHTHHTHTCPHNGCSKMLPQVTSIYRKSQTKFPHFESVLPSLSFLVQCFIKTSPWTDPLHQDLRAVMNASSCPHPREIKSASLKLESGNLNLNITLPNKGWEQLLKVFSALLHFTSLIHGGFTSLIHGGCPCGHYSLCTLHSFGHGEEDSRVSKGRSWTGNGLVGLSFSALTKTLALLCFTLIHWHLPIWSFFNLI